jgi:ribosomal protein L27
MAIGRPAETAKNLRDLKSKDTSVLNFMWREGKSRVCNIRQRGTKILPGNNVGLGKIILFLLSKKVQLNSGQKERLISIKQLQLKKWFT